MSQEYRKPLEFRPTNIGVAVYDQGVFIGVLADTQYGLSFFHGERTLDLARAIADKLEELEKGE